MFSDFSRRNQRSNSNKIKHGLQVCFLVAVCLWLMYQIRHTYDTKKEFDPQSDWTVKIVTNDKKLGRKDLKPKMQETVITIEDLNEEQDDENGIEKEKNKLEDEDEDEEELDLEFKKKNNENNIKLDTKHGITFSNKTGPSEIDENPSSEIQSETDINDDGATFGDITGVHTNFLNENVDTDGKTKVIEEDRPVILVRDEIQKENKGL